MGHKIIASVAGVLLVSFAVVGAFASQDGISTQQEEPTATATDTETATATATEEADTPTPTPTTESTETPEATETAEATETPDGDDEDGDDVHGIPDSNPSKEPNDDDVCEKGETDIKITPSGNEVMVPCHAADKEHKNKEDGNRLSDDDEGDADEDDESDDEDDESDDEDEEDEDQDEEDDS